jgi:hypothetical protein
MAADTRHCTDVRRASDEKATLDHTDKVGALRRVFLCSVIVNVYSNTDCSPEGACDAAEDLLRVMQARGWMP